MIFIIIIIMPYPFDEENPSAMPGSCFYSYLENYIEILCHTWKTISEYQVITGTLYQNTWSYLENYASNDNSDL